PGARVLASQSLDEAAAFARSLREAPPDLIVSAGGDGTAVALINALRDGLPRSTGNGSAAGRSTVGAAGASAFGVLPLGTGNGWARVTGAPAWRTALNRLGRASQRPLPLPSRRFDLVEV